MPQSNHMKAGMTLDIHTQGSGQAKDWPENKLDFQVRWGEGCGLVKFMTKEQGRLLINV